MNIALWIVQILLAVAFLGAGIMKSTQSKEKLGEKMAWVEDFSPGMIRFIGIAEVLGAIGLILPAVTGIAPVLVPLAATGLAVAMVGAIITHVRRSELNVIGANVALLLLAAFVAWGRFGAYAF